MRRAAAVVLTVMMLAACDSGGDEPPTPPTYRLDSSLRLNQIQVLGTHNSYHVAPPAGANLTPERDITQAPLTVQLEQQSVRQIELDVHSTGGGPLAVFHLRGDEGTTCATFVACLRDVRGWSDSHHGHVPLFILVEPKHEIGALVDAVAVDTEIRSVFSADKLLTPDDVRGNWPTLRQAVQEGGWPLLGAVRNKVVFVYNDEIFTRSTYTSGETSLQGRAMFVYASPPSPIAAVASVPDARLEGLRIASLVRAGLIVRTRADDSGVEARANDFSRAEAALASGAHLVSTDFPAPAPSGYVVPAPGTPARCNPLTVPPETACTPQDIEKLG